eukprot:GHRQ01016735.1.p1 GENE.GHRQ01016735.1~~GHRQ01016735.1.p1  ORF type:complete len:306 (-),score=70.58 GHRQ01016735.1:220-1137(-)
MSRAANNATRGSRLPLLVTITGSRLPPSQLWLMKRATLPCLVASMQHLRQLVPEGSCRRTTSSAWPRSSVSYCASRRCASVPVTYSPAYSATKDPRLTACSAFTHQPYSSSSSSSSSSRQPESSTVYTNHAPVVVLAGMPEAGTSSPCVGPRTAPACAARYPNSCCESPLYICCRGVFAPCVGPTTVLAGAEHHFICSRVSHLVLLHLQSWLAPHAAAKATNLLQEYVPPSVHYNSEVTMLGICCQHCGTCCRSVPHLALVPEQCQLVQHTSLRGPGRAAAAAAGRPTLQQPHQPCSAALVLWHK